jgi:hypothetical protein
MNAPETTTCGTCGATAFYRGTMDGIRVYVCRDKHITNIKRTVQVETVEEKS